jgi:hypothetical protein
MRVELNPVFPRIARRDEEQVGEIHLWTNDETFTDRSHQHPVEQKLGPRQKIVPEVKRRTGRWLVCGLPLLGQPVENPFHDIVNRFNGEPQGGENLSKQWKAVLGFHK